MTYGASGVHLRLQVFRLDGTNERAGPGLTALVETSLLPSMNEDCYYSY